MQKNSIEDRFIELYNDKVFICTQKELEEFQNYGYIMSSNGKYITRKGDIINVKLQKLHNMTINLNKILINSDEICKNIKCNKIYYMSKDMFDKYDLAGNIVYKDNVKFYRMFDNELWYIVII